MATPGWKWAICAAVAVGACAAGYWGFEREMGGAASPAMSVAQKERAALAALAKDSWSAGGAVEASAPGDFERAMAGPGKSLVVFEASWCPECKTYIPMAHKWAQAKGVKVVFVDVNARPDIAQKNKIMAYPATMGFLGDKPFSPLRFGDLGEPGLEEFAALWGAPPAKKDGWRGWLGLGF